MTATVVGALLLSLGVVLLRHGLSAATTPLSRLLAGSPDVTRQERVRSSRVPDRADVLRRLDESVGRALVRLFPDLDSDSLRADQRVSGLTTDSLALNRLVAMLLGPLAALVLLAVRVFEIIQPPWLLIGVVGIGATVFGWFVPVMTLRSEASDARAEFRFALSAYLDLVSINLVGGSPVQESMLQAVSAGKGWVFDELGRALAETREGRQPWEALARLARDLELAELEEVTSSMTLAGVEGARVGDTLTAKAETLRARRLADAEAKAGRKSEQMSAAVALLALGILLFVLYPILSRLGADVTIAGQ